MIEKEIKIRINSLEDLNIIERNILAKGGSFIGAYNMVDEYFNHPARNFASTDEALRIRKYDDIVELTYKGPKVIVAPKTRKEITVKIDDYLKLREILLLLGFSIVGKIIKKRKMFNYKNYLISLDSVKDLGYFVEIEGQYMRMEDYNNIMKELEIKGTCVKESYLELMLKSKSKSS